MSLADGNRLARSWIAGHPRTSPSQEERPKSPKVNSLTPRNLFLDELQKVLKHGAHP